MSDRDAQGQNPRLLRALIWAGVGLAPVAALLVLLGNEGPTRFGVLLVAVSVVLLGAALLIRNDPVLLRMDVEDRVADEVNALRDELREEILAASAMAPRRREPPPRVPAPPGHGFGVPVRESGAPGHGFGVPVRESGAPGHGFGVPVREPAPSARASAAPVREVGQTTGGRAAMQPEPGTRTGGRVVAAAARPPAGPAGGRGAAPPPPPGHGPPLGPVHAPSDPGHEPFDPGRETFDRGHGTHDPGYGRLDAAPPAHPGHLAPVPGQRGRGVVAPPPMAPVFQPPPSRTYGAPAEPARDQGGRRRADGTAVDLGYTGRRAKPDHRHEDDDRHGGYGDPVPGYPGWAEADERHPAGQPLNEQYDWRGRERTGGW